MREEAIRSISDWVIALALDEVQIDTAFGAFCERLVDAGIPLRRGHLAVRALHPMFASMTATWTPAGGLDVQHLPHGADDTPDWRGSPLHAMIEARAVEVRYRLDRPGDWSKFPLLRQWAERGATDYLAILTPFGDPATAFHRRDGVICTWLTDGSGGFGKDDVAALRRLQLRLGVAAKVSKREQTAAAIVAAYLGADAGRRVLAGQIRRGDGERIRAVLWYADMRDSTSLAERMTPEAFLDMLDRYFECTAGAVLEQGGQVLSFIGDAVLGVFPLEDRDRAGGAAKAALTASLQASQLVEAANAQRSACREPLIRFGLGLHVGDVLYGNIGVPERLEFSVIGRAANAVARIEGLTKTLERPLLASAAFAESVEAVWRSCGRQTLRGMAEDMEIFALADPGDVVAAG